MERGGELAAVDDVVEEAVGDGCGPRTMSSRSMSMVMRSQVWLVAATRMSTIRRRILTTSAILWRLVGDGDAWETWMVDDADVRVAPGSSGHVVDDGVGRTVRVDRRDDDGDHHQVGFTWWPDDRPDRATAVELVVLPAPAGSRLLVTGTRANATSSARAWDVRLLLLAVRAILVAV